MTKKILSMLLAVLMVVSMIPLTAAAEGETGPAGTEKDPFTVGVTTSASTPNFPTTDKTILKFTKNGYYKLTSNIVTRAITKDGDDVTDVTLDLNGFNITWSNYKADGSEGNTNNLFYVGGNGPRALTVINTQKEYKSVITGPKGSSNTFLLSGASPELTIGENITVQKPEDATNRNAYAVAVHENTTGTAKITLNGCVIEDAHGLYMNGKIGANASAEDSTSVQLKLNGATIKATSASGVGIYQAGYGDTSDVTAVNSNITGASVGIEVRAGKLNLVNTTVKSEGKDKYAEKPSNNGGTTWGSALTISQHTTNQPIDVTLDENVVLEGPVALSIIETVSSRTDENAKKVTVNVKGGKYTAVTSSGVEQSDGNIIEGSKGIDRALRVTATKANVTVSGGEFNGDVEIKAGSNVSITGGQFKDEAQIKNFVAKTHIVSKDTSATLEYSVVAAAGLVGDPVKVDAEGVAKTEVTGIFTGEDGNKAGNTTESSDNSVTIKATTGKTKENEQADKTEITIKGDTAESMSDFDKDGEPVDGTAPSMTIETDKATVVLDSAAVGQIAKAAKEKGDVKIEVEKNTVPSGAKYMAEYTVDVKAGTSDHEALKKSVLEAAGASVEITITVDKPETAKATDEIQAWYVEDGLLNEKLGCEVNGDKLDITIGHLSTIRLQTIAANAVIVKDNGDTFPTDAITVEAALAEGGNYTLLKDVDLKATVAPSNALTIKGDGHTITPASGFEKDRVELNALFKSGQNLTFENVTLDAKGVCYVINQTAGTLTIDDKATVKGGKGFTGETASAGGGVYVTGGTLEVKKGATISSNTSGVADDGYLEYAADVYVGSGVTATINGTVGDMYAEATGVTVGATGKVGTAFVDFKSSAPSSITVNKGASIETLLLPLDYITSGNVSDRAIAKIASVVAPTDVSAPATLTTGTVPEKQTATVVGQKAKTGGTKDNKEVTINNNKTIVIGEDATLTIPEGTKVTVKDDTVEITNNGTLDVRGSLVCAEEDDDKYVKLEGDGEIIGKDIDVDTSEKTGLRKIVTVKFYDDKDEVDSIAKIIVRNDGDKTTGTWPTATVTPPTAPTKTGKEFVYWAFASGEGKVYPGQKVTIPADAENNSSIAYYAKYIEAQGGEDPGAKNPFTDLVDDWYKDAVQYVYDNGLMAGTDKDKFSPKRNLTRAQVAQILYAMAGAPTPTGSVDVFTDVVPGEWYVDAIKWAVGENIMGGVSADKMAPNADISRQQLALMLYAYAGHPEVAKADAAVLENFTDKGSVDDWAADAMTWAVKNGYISGTSADKLSPKGTANRAQAAIIIMNYHANNK